MKEAPISQGKGMLWEASVHKATELPLSRPVIDHVSQWAPEDLNKVQKRNLPC